ncbi:hypothetical protein V498_01416 [Pseudogymnoascus sp. VKM F-4517 (FW-2822)]|nr:hypothetical protein V498_01416 [Pseudogymnoascus sp. VKM F-4517 (FW-2822)]
MRRMCSRKRAIFIASVWPIHRQGHSVRALPRKQLTMQSCPVIGALLSSLAAVAKCCCHYILLTPPEGGASHCVMQWLLPAPHLRRPFGLSRRV